MRRSAHLLFSVPVERPSRPARLGPKAPVLDSGRFVKLVRDSGLLDSRLTATAVELTFSKVKGQVSDVSSLACNKQDLDPLPLQSACGADLLQSQGPGEMSPPRCSLA